MKHSLKYCSYLLVGLLICIASCTPDPQSEEHLGSSEISNLYSPISSDHSNITFSNDLKEDVSTKFNLLDFDYFYNGAGVGVADLDNDGLEDLVFSGNQVQNRIYKNMGSLVFEDVTENSGINTGKYWSNGVTFADINGDGWLDIYISQGGPHESAARKNLLLINQKNFKFEEQAEEYGLADSGLSTQSAFFDYDKDGDLDCIVSNESIAYGVDPINFNNLMVQKPEVLAQSTSKLYRNDSGRFIDVTESAGLLAPSFGLGLAVSDIDKDGWLDIYIANDYFIPDAMYINQKDGTFKNTIKQNTSQLSMFGMGVDIADINNDGHQDIFVLDMASSDHYRSKTLMASMSTENFNMLVNVLKYQYQYMFNTFQLNDGQNQFKNVAHQIGIAKTDWSWAGLIADYDNDGHKDVFVTNGYRRYALDNDFKTKVNQAKAKYRGNVPLEVKQQLYNEMPSEPLANLMYRNVGSLKFKSVGEDWGLQKPSYSNGAVYADLDNDGDLDLVTNNIDQLADIYRNNATENGNNNYLKINLVADLSESFAKIKLEYGEDEQYQEVHRVRGYFSAVSSKPIFGLADAKTIDKLIVTWPSGNSQTLSNVATNQTIDLLEKDAKTVVDKADANTVMQKVPNDKLQLFYRHLENEFDDFEKEILLPYKQSSIGPFITKADVNNDGKDDIYIGGAAGIPAQLFLQSTDGFVPQSNPAFVADKAQEDMRALFFDVDVDGDQDLFVPSGGNEFSPKDITLKDRLYINDGAGNFTKSSFDDAKMVNSRVALSLDYDGDGDEDLIVGARMTPQHYPRPDFSVIYENENGKLVESTDKISKSFKEFGMVNDLISTDFDGDGDLDFIAVGEWTGIGMFENQDGVFENVADKYDLADLKGWWFDVAKLDVNEDGRDDYVVGNVGLNTKFKTSTEKPFKVFANDFDANGTFDIVLSNEYKGEYVPVRGKECSSQQMPFISQKFQSYDEFAKASIIDIYGESLKNSSEYEVSTFESVLILSEGDAYRVEALPAEAQSFPMLSILVSDINGDGKEDLMAAGNIYNTEVETPRWDGGSGLIMKAMSDNKFRVVPNTESGFHTRGNLKTQELIEVNGDSYVLGGVNEGLLSIHKINK